MSVTIKTPEQIREAVGAIGKTIERADYFAIRTALAAGNTPKIRDATGKTIPTHFEPTAEGVVVIKAQHHCMSTRGVHKHDTDMVTSRMTGVFRRSGDSGVAEPGEQL